MKICSKAIDDKKDLIEKLFPFIITAIFLTISIILITRHEFWSDEAHAWILGSDSSSIKEFISNMRVREGHPYLWSGILYFVSHFITRNIESMKIIHLAISTISVFLILKYAPFNKILRILIIFSYFLFYEYSIICRNYALGVLFLVIFCVLYKNKYRNIIPLSILLVLLGQSNIYTFIISVALFLMLAIEFLIGREFVKKNVNKTVIIAAVFIFLAGILFTYWQLGSQLPVKSENASLFSIFAKSSEEYLKAFSSISRGVISAYLPLPQFQLAFWGSNLIVNFLSQYNIVITFLFAAGLSIIPIFIIKRRFLFLYIFGSLCMLAIPLFLYSACLRHYGNLFLLFLACLWLSNISRKDRYLINFKGNVNKILQTIFLIVILIPSIIGSIVAFHGDYKDPFSMGKSTAEYIEDNFNVDDIVIVGYPGGRPQIISAYLDKDIYYPQSESFKQLVLIDYRIGIEYSNESLFEIASSFFNKGSPVLLVIVSRSYYKLSPWIMQNYTFEKVELDDKFFIVPSDNYHLFLFSRETILNKYSTRLISRIDNLNLVSHWENLNKCEFILKEGNVLIKASGYDPHFENSFLIESKEDESLLVVVNLYSLNDEQFQIYYKEKGGQYSEGNSISRLIYEGGNEIYLKLPYIENLEKIRIDPVLQKNDCCINKIEIYGCKEK